jgi:UDP-4-amino-4,6-dideoxy-N-acetyl-beta-L-altrosamine N-acetyltransferase
LPTIEFRGVKLRPMSECDQEMVLRWRTDKAIGQVMYSQLETQTIEAQINWFRTLENSVNQEYWVIERHDVPVGVVNLSNISKDNLRADWAFYIGACEFRGKGIGALVEYAIIYYVFEYRNFKKLCCQVLSNNLNVAMMHRKFGFIDEGLLVKHFFRNGVWLHVHLLAMWSEEAFRRGYDKLAVSIREN